MSFADWRERVTEETGKSPDRLAARTWGGITIDPLFADRPTVANADTAAGRAPHAAAASCVRLPASTEAAVRVVHTTTPLDVKHFWWAEPGDIPPAVEEAVRAGGATVHTARDRFEDAFVNTAETESTAASGVAYDAAGASLVQQLGAACASLVEAVRAAEGDGHSAADAFSRLSLRVATDRDVLLTVSALRAMRLLHTKVAVGLGVSVVPPTLHAVMSAREWAALDVETNMLRATTAAFGAIVGGADLVTLLPYDGDHASPHSLRLLAHTVNVLRQECDVATVVDAAGGAYAFEHLTNRLARAAWDYFRQIETAGGLAAYVTAGKMHADCNETWAAREAAVAVRKTGLIGINRFAATDEPEAAPGGPERRDTLAFEALRAQANALATAGHRPRVFLANLGPTPEHRARTGFARDFFRAGGFEVIESTSTGDATPEAAAAQIVAAWPEANAALVCLCAADATYDTHAAPAASALKQAGADRVWIAGRPNGREGTADDFIFEGAHVHALLAKALPTAEGASR